MGIDKLLMLLLMMVFCHYVMLCLHYFVLWKNLHDTYEMRSRDNKYPKHYCDVTYEKMKYCDPSIVGIIPDE